MFTKKLLKMFAVLLMFATLSFGFSTKSVQATTLYCDNDASQTMYPCSNSKSGAFYYRTDNPTGSLNMNSDYELSNDWDIGKPLDFYHWKVQTGKLVSYSYTLQVWLSNPYFTNSGAQYSVDGSQVGYPLNQRIAKSGYNTVATFSDYGTIDIGVSSGDYNMLYGATATGADVVSLTTSAY